MKENEDFACDCVEVACDEPSITNAHLHNAVNDKMEHSALKSKGHVRPEDLRLFCCPKKNSISDNELRSSDHPTYDNLSLVKSGCIHSNSNNIKLRVSPIKLAEKKLKNKSQDEQKALCNASGRRASKLTVEISCMLKILSEMHSRGDSPQNNKDFFPAEELNASIKEIEMVDHDCCVTMKDISPMEERSN